jgi:hypothetical protein
VSGRAHFAEEWCVEAESADEARELLGAKQDHRCHLGESLHAEVANVLDDDDAG